MARRQRAASHIRATESGPPDTARTSARLAFQSEKSRLVSVSAIGDPVHAFNGFVARADDLVRATDAHPKRQTIAIQIVNLEITHAIGTIARRMHNGRPSRPQFIVQRVDLGREHVDGASARLALRLVRGLQMNRHFVPLNTGAKNRITISETHP